MLSQSIKVFLPLCGRLARLRLMPAMLLLLAISSAHSFAAALSWGTGNTPNYNWTAGAPGNGASVNQSFETDSTHAGTDVNIALTNLNTNSTWNSGYPAVDQTTTGGTANKNALQVYMNSNNSAGVTVTITFTYGSGYLGAQNVAFSLFDVDKQAGTWIDQISNITATTYQGTTVGATITAGTDNQLTGSGTGAIVTGTNTNNNGSGGGNVNINFGSNIVTSVTFTWKNTDAGQGTQVIGLGDISYTPVKTPETGSGIAAVAICGLAVGWRRLRKKRATA